MAGDSSVEKSVGYNCICIVHSIIFMFHHLSRVLLLPASLGTYSAVRYGQLFRGQPGTFEKRHTQVARKGGW
jgi:hypothetical protein